MTTIIKKDIPKRNTNQIYNGGGSTTIIQGTPTPVIDNLNSNDSKSALSANLGKILNDNKLSSLNKDTAREVITFDRGLESKMDIKAGGFGPTNTGIGAAIYLNNSDWNMIADNAVFRKQTTIGSKLVSTDYNTNPASGFVIFKDPYNLWDCELDNGIFRENLIINKKLLSIDYNERLKQGTAIYKDTNDDWNAIVDNLVVRNKLDVFTLEVNHAKHIGGDVYLTCAGIICSKVEVVQEGEMMVRYKCYFKNKNADGLIINNMFEPGDLAFCLTFDNNLVRKWWRAVHGVGRDYIIVDDLQCLPGSDVPKEGDHIVQLGNITRTEESKKRQSAIILWTDAICLYRDIVDFVLPEPYIRLDPRNTKIDAESINFLGETIINGNFVVDKSGNLTVKGRIIATSGEFTGTIKANDGNIGLFTIKDGGLYNNPKQGAAFINITDNDDSTKATKQFIVNPRDLAPEEKGAIVDITHKVNEGDGLVASTTNGNAIWGITEDGQALTGYATGIGHGLSCNRASIRGLELNVANIRFDGDNEARLTNLEEIDIVKIDKGVTSPYKIILLPPLNYTQGRRLTVINRSNVSHRIISQPLADGTSERFEKLNGDVPIIKLDMGDGRIVEVFGFEVNRYTAVELLNTGDTWTIINVYR